MERKRALSAETRHGHQSELESSKQDEYVLPLRTRRQQPAACNPSIGSLRFGICSTLAFTSSAVSSQAAIPPPAGHSGWGWWEEVMSNSEASLPFLCAWKPLLKHAVAPKSMDFGTRCTRACTLFFWDEFFLAVVVCHITLGTLRKMHCLPVSVSREFGAVPLGGTDSSLL